MSEIFESIQQKSVELLKRANDQIAEKENHFWYNGEFYTGSVSPEVLFIGFNPGYGRDDWPKRADNTEALSKPFTLKPIKYIEEKKDKARLAEQIYFLLGCITENPESFLLEKTAETNLIHFNTPDIAIYTKSLSMVESGLRNEIENHFADNFCALMHDLHPKVLFINGKSTYDQLRRKIAFNDLTILETNSQGQMVCAKTTLKEFENVQILVSKHLSSPMSDSQLGSIAQYFKAML